MSSSFYLFLSTMTITGMLLLIFGTDHTSDVAGVTLLLAAALSGGVIVIQYLLQDHEHNPDQP